LAAETRHEELLALTGKEVDMDPSLLRVDSPEVGVHSMAILPYLIAFLKPSTHS
jgi:hypothetical protein